MIERTVRMRKGIFRIYAVVVLFALLSGCGRPAVMAGSDNTDKTPIETANTVVTTGLDNEKPSETELAVLDVGQGLCVLVESGGEYMIYDGGGGQHSSFVVAYLKRINVTSVKYLFASHYDEDHISGLIGVLHAIPVQTAIIPNYEADTAIYDSFISAVQNADTVEYAARGSQYELGNARVDVLYAADGSENTENDKSTVVSIQSGDFSCIITGDAEYETESKLMENAGILDCDAYIVGHHGSSSSSNPEFVNAMSPAIAVIGVGPNEYGHPTEQTIQTLSNCGAAIYRTDTQGTVRISYKNNESSVFTEGKSRNRGDSEDVTYVLNNGTRKFHRPDCSSVPDIADYHKEYSYASREELLDQGYSPCGRCKP